MMSRTIEGKVTLLDQLIFVEAEVEDIEIWKTVYHAEGSELPSGMAYRLRMCQQLVRTLELVKAHEAAIVTLVKSARGIRRVSTATSSARSTPTSAESEESTEPSHEPTDS
jgi:hypothetical protein